MNMNWQTHSILRQELHRRKLWMHEHSLYDLSSAIDPCRTLNTEIYDLENELMNVFQRHRAIADALLAKLEELESICECKPCSEENKPEVTA
jgi:aspartate aminotransferase-like enzyme